MSVLAGKKKKKMVMVIVMMTMEKMKKKVAHSVPSSLHVVQMAELRDSTMASA